MKKQKITRHASRVVAAVAITMFIASCSNDSGSVDSGETTGEDASVTAPDGDRRDASEPPDEDLGTVVGDVGSESDLAGMAPDAGVDASTSCQPPGCCLEDNDCVAPETCQPDQTCGDQPGPVFDVPHAGIADHGDPSVTGSLAWRLQYLSAGQTARLVDVGPYVVESIVDVPAGTTILGRSGQMSVIEAGSGLRGGSLIRFADNSTASNVVLDGGWNVTHIMRASQTTGVTISGTHLRRTRNDWPAGSDPRCHGVVAVGATDLTFEDANIHDIGYPKMNPRQWPGICAGIWAPENTNLTVRNSTIRNTLTAGIDFTSTIGAVITDNTIKRTGRNIEYWQSDYDLPVADGITAYSNGSGFTYQGFRILRNTVEDSGNHGIHLSGRDLEISDNVIDSPFGQGIIVDDHRPPADCASRVVIERNTIRNLRSGGNRHAIYMGRDHKPGAHRIQDNNPQQVFFRPDSACQ